MTVTFTTKLGTTKGAERSRIWIEGKRLSMHGFEVGTRFLKTWSEGSLTLTLLTSHDSIPLSVIGTVSGKGEKPIIDIVGAKVRSTFTGTHVLVTYNDRHILIRGSNESPDSV